jgi:hypothetical protein
METIKNYFGYGEKSELVNENENIKKVNDTIIDELNILKIKYNEIKKNLTKNIKRVEQAEEFKVLLNNELNEKNNTISYLQLKLLDYETHFLKQKIELEELNNETQRLHKQVNVLVCENQLLKKKKSMNIATQTNTENESKSIQTKLDFTKYHFKGE